jgi:kynurenine formamidase
MTDLQTKTSSPVTSSRSIIDISVPLQAGIASDPPALLPEIDYHTHAETAEEVVSYFPGATIEDLPDREGWAIERLRVTTHSGTHLDAPYHYSAIMDGGDIALTIDEVPLEWCLQPAVKLDFRHLPDGYVATAADVEAELTRIGHTLSALEIVVVNTSAGTRYGQPDYVSSGCGMGRDATLYLLERGVRVTGTDAWSWDAPFVHTAKRYAADRDPSVIWEGHRAGREIGYCHLEKLHNLEQLPSSGFQVSCFPVKIHQASAGWTRAVAILDS